jgi:Transcriptional regulator
MVSQCEAAAPPARQPGRPRSAKADRAIIDATIALLAEGTNLAELSIEAIAQRAGVGKSTIYRRWPGKEDLVLDAIATLRTPPPDVTGLSARDALVRFLGAIRHETTHPRLRCLLNIAMCERDRYPTLMERFREIAIEPQQAALREILRRGVADRELRPDLDIEVAVAALSGAMVYFTKWGGGEEFSADLPERVVDNVLRGFAAPPPPDGPATPAVTTPSPATGS